MDKKRIRNILLISVVTSLSIVVILLAAGFAAKNKNYEPASWVLKTYGNNVALYNGENVDTVYGGIVLSNLPPEDIKILENGIAFPTKKEAEQAIEDYDG